MAVAEEPPRSAEARAAAELALVRVIHYYGETPSFVLLGGLVPALLCAGAPWRHAGTTDVDVQVNLEIATGSHHAPRLERALGGAGFSPSADRVWRWVTSTAGGTKAEVKFELLADLDDQPAGAEVVFDGCEHLGAANLSGTGYAARDVVLHDLSAEDEGVTRNVRVAMSGLAGFLLAKLAAAAGRRKPKDWYDIAFVLLHNDAGGVAMAAQLVNEKFPAAPLARQGRGWSTCRPTSPTAPPKAWTPTSSRCFWTIQTKTRASSRATHSLRSQSSVGCSN